MEIRFDDAGSVRAKSFEVLPIQIYTAQGVTDDDVLYRDNLVWAASILRGICCLYTLLLILVKLRYRVVVGNYIVLKSVMLDLAQIFLGVYPVYQGYQLQ